MGKQPDGLGTGNVELELWEVEIRLSAIGNFIQAINSEMLPAGAEFFGLGMIISDYAEKLKTIRGRIEEQSEGSKPDH